MKSKKKRIIPVIIAITTMLITAGLTGSAGAAALRQAVVPAEANWVVHVNVEQFKDAQLGGLILDELASKGLDDKLAAFETMTGWNPLYDLADVTICGPDTDKNKAVVILHGNFDKEKVLAALARNESHKQKNYGNIVIHQWFNKRANKLQYGAFLRDKIIVVANNPRVVIREIAVITKKAKNITSTNKLLALQKIPDGTFITVVGDNVSRLFGDKARAAVVRNTRQASLFVGENDGNVFARCNLVFDNEQKAIQIERIIKGMIAFAVLHQDKMPVKCDIANVIKVKRIADELNVQFACPPDKVFACMKIIAAHKKMIKNKIHHRRQNRRAMPRRGNR